MFVKIFLKQTLQTHRQLNLTRFYKVHTHPLFSSHFNLRYNNSVRESHRKSIYKREEAKKIRFYIIHKYVEYLKNYDKTLEKAFPKFTSVYRIFTEGVRKFIIDVKNYFKIVHFLYTPGNNLKKLTRKEIELYEKIPKDMRKVAPTLIISSLPFAFYIVLPAIYFFPKQLLTDHFWNLQERSDFTIQYLRARLLHNRPIFRYLQLQLDNLKDHKLYQPWNTVLGMLGSGLQPTPEQILECKELFSAEPYHLFYLSHLHVRHLLKVHELHLGWFRRTRLADRAVILIAMDKAIMREEIGRAHV